MKARPQTATPNSPGILALALAAPFFLAASLSVASAADFTGWRFQHPFSIDADGLVEVEVPASALDAARTDRGDLRIAGPAGEEIPFLHLVPQHARTVNASGITPSLSPGQTRLEIAVPGDRPATAVLLRSPAKRFLKAVRAEASADNGVTWSPLVEGVPVFRTTDGSEQLRVEFPPTSARRLRLTIDDSSSPPVPFSGPRIVLIPDHPTHPAPLADGVTIVERIELPGETRLEIDLGAAHLDLHAIGITAEDPLFMRRLSLLAPAFEEAEIHEKTLAQGSVFRVAIDGAAPRSQDSFLTTLSAPTPTRHLTLAVDNGDSPPLRITRVHASRIPLRIRFLATAPGTYTLYSGNPAAPAPDYDLAPLGRALATAEATHPRLSTRKENPTYAATNQLPQIPLAAAPLDPRAWAFRKSVTPATPGIQQLELDPEALAGSGLRGADWRLVRNGNQIPFIIQRAGGKIVRPISPETSPANTPDRPGRTRWKIDLPHPSLPLQSLLCRSTTPLFDRQVALVEETTDSYGQKRRRTLASGRWVRSSAPSDSGSEANLILDIDSRPETGTLILEIEDGDNAPIEIHDITLYHPVVRLLFKTADTAPLHLYYGNPKAAPARYDLSLAAPQLLRAHRTKPHLARAEPVSRRGGPNAIGGHAGIVFWATLVIVVLGLLLLVARLLPGTSPTPPPSGDS